MILSVADGGFKKTSKLGSNSSWTATAIDGSAGYIVHGTLAQRPFHSTAASASPHLCPLINAPSHSSQRLPRPVLYATWVVTRTLPTVRQPLRYLLAEEQTAEK